MPIYKFRDTVKDEIFEVTLRISDYESFMVNNPTVERYFDIDDVPATVSGVGGIKTDSGFKEVLSKISDAHPNSQLSERHTTKSIKQSQTDQVFNKHFGK
jgi:hypothetical protein